MLARRTVFILGAGASYELGLPLGEKLRELIAKLVDIRYDHFSPISGDDQINHFLREISREREYRNISALLHKCWLMRDALPGSISIDNLIDAHRNDPEFAEIGKMAIAKAIISAERGSKLYVNPNEIDNFSLAELNGTFLITLFQILSEGLPREDVNSIFSNASFIVFNYDRCLEAFLPRAIEKYYGLPLNDAIKIAQSATIIHPYGRVGEFGRDRSLATAGFGSERCNIRSIAQGIRTFSEGLADEGHGKQIQMLMQEADQIVFLGFAFHPLNMEILTPKGPSFADKVFGTTLGLSEAAVRSVEAGLLQILGKRAPGDFFPESEPSEILSELNLEPRTATDFLQAHFRSIA